MAWEIKDEWIDFAYGRHVVVFHNRDVLVPDEAGKMAPVEHHLKHEFKLPACPHCGHAAKSDAGEPLDFGEKKREMLERLNEHHRSMREYAGKHPGVKLHHGRQAG